MLSTITKKLFSFAIWLIARKSEISMVGLVGVSKKIALVLGLMAALISSSLEVWTVVNSTPFFAFRLRNNRFIVNKKSRRHGLQHNYS